MAKTPRPVPRNRAGAPTPRSPRRRRRRDGTDPLTVFAVALLVVLLVWGLLALLAGTGSEGTGSHGSLLLPAGATPNNVRSPLVSNVAPRGIRPTLVPQPGTHGLSLTAMTGGVELNLQQGLGLNYRLVHKLEDGAKSFLATEAAGMGKYTWIHVAHEVWIAAV